MVKAPASLDSLVLTIDGQSILAHLYNRHTCSAWPLREGGRSDEFGTTLRRAILIRGLPASQRSQDGADTLWVHRAEGENMKRR